MTDTSNDTASGGLENDMPGIGNAPASPRLVPQGLGGLVSAFGRMFSGAPAPMPPQFGQRPQRAPIDPHGPRWAGTTASLFLPQGSDQPPAKFTPFMGTLPTTDPSQWGQPDQYPNLPQSHELPSIAKGLSQFFGQMGGGQDPLSGIAMAMGGHSEAYIKGLMQGQEYRSKIERERWLEKSYQLQDQLEKRHTLYANTLGLFNEYTNGDPSKLDTVRIKGQSWRDRMLQDAMQTGDKDIEQMIHDGRTAQQIMDYQNLRDARLKDLQKVNEKAQQQEEEDNKEREEAGLPPKSGGQSSTDPLAPRPKDDQSFTPQGAAPPSGSPAPEMAPDAKDPNAPKPDPDAPAPDASIAQGETPEAAPLKPYQEDGNNVLRGEANINSYPKAIRDGIQNWAAQQGAKLDQIKNGVTSGRIKPEDIPAALDKVIPGAGEEYTNTLEGAPLPTGVAGRSKYWQTIKGMIPGFNPIIQDATLRDFASGGKSGTRLTAGMRMSDAAITVLTEMKKFKEGELPPENIVNQWIATGVTGDPKWSNLFNAVNTYMQEHQSLQSPTGRFFESEMQEQRKNLRITQGLPVIRGMLKIDAMNASKLADQLRENYRRGARQQSDPPTYSPEKEEILKALTNLDEQKGFADIPEDRLPEPLRGLGLGQGAKGSTGDGKVHDWREYFQ